MKTFNYSLEGRIKLNLEHHQNSPQSQLLSTDFYLEVSKGLDPSKYNLPDGTPNKTGAQALTQILAQGVVALIKFSEFKGYRNPDDLKQYFISEIDRGLAAKKESTIGEYQTDNSGGYTPLTDANINDRFISIVAIMFDIMENLSTRSDVNLPIDLQVSVDMAYLMLKREKDGE